MVRVINTQGLEVIYQKATGWAVDSVNNTIKIKQNDVWIATAPMSSIVDFGSGNMSKFNSIELAIDLLTDGQNIRLCKSMWKLLKLKKLLDTFSIRNREWKQ